MMRGLLAKRLKFHLPIAFTLAIGAAITFKVSVTHMQKLCPLVQLYIRIVLMCVLWGQLSQTGYVYNEMNFTVACLQLESY